MKLKVVLLTSPPTVALLPRVPSPSPSKSKIRRERQYVEVSARVFCLVWVGTLFLRAACAAYYFAVGRVYAVSTITTWLGNALRFYKWGMDPDEFSTIATVHYVIGSIHCFIIALTITWSIYRRQLSFGPMQAYKPPLRRAVTLSSLDEARPSWCTRLSEFVRTLFSRTCFFGVESEYFDVQRVVLEVVEVVLLTIQAYRMCKYVPRKWVNMFVGLLVTNCMVTPIIHVAVTRNALVRRVLTLACDSILDLFSSLVIPVILAVLYSKDYDPVLRGFGPSLLLNDIWFVNASSEFKLILVTSYGDLASRSMVAFGLIASLETANALVRAGHNNRQGSDVSSNSEKRSLTIARVLSASGEVRSWIRTAPWGKRLHVVFHLVLSFWGEFVLVLHSRRPPLFDSHRALCRFGHG